MGSGWNALSGELFGRIGMLYRQAACRFPTASQSCLDISGIF